MSRVSPDGTVERFLPSGLAIHAVSTLDIDFLYREIFEQEIYVQHGISIAEGSTVIDCGANIGLFSIYAAEAAGSSVSVLLDRLGEYQRPLSKVRYSSERLFAPMCPARSPALASMKAMPSAHG